MSKRTRKRILFSYLQLSNTGCEIIVRGTIAFLKRALPEHDLRFIISSYPHHVDRDRALLADLPEVEIVPMLGWKRFLRALLRQTKRFDRFWTPRFSSAAFKSSDLFVSIGGDIYTIFDGRIPDDWMGYEGFATRCNIPSIMFGANMEKFEMLSDADHALLIEHLNRFKLLAVRDRATCEYLAQHSVTAPVEVYPDPIFTIRTATTVHPIKVKTIGLNLSPLAIEKFGEGLVDRYATMVSEMIRAGYAFRFIPHVFSSDGEEWLDDRIVLRRIYDALPDDLQVSVELCDEALGLAKVSEAIAGVDLMVAARMHCCLNALTMGKPVYFVEYSAKAKMIISWLKSETQYEKIADIFTSGPANIVDRQVINTFISEVEAFGEVVCPHRVDRLVC